MTDPAPTDPHPGVIPGEEPHEPAPEELVEDLPPAEHHDAGPVSRADYDALEADRDQYLEAVQRLKAEFANHRRRTDEQRGEVIERAAAGLVEKLLPVLDACDAALAQGAEAVQPVASLLETVLAADGLERIAEPGEIFDPERHEAVVHSAGESDADGTPVVAEVLRAGFAWKGRVVRPAMVRVEG